MQTAQKLRPVAEYERTWGNVLVLPHTYENLEVGVRVQTQYCGGVSSVFGRVKSMVDLDHPEYDYEFASVLYDSGWLSRHPQRGHGYILLYGDRVEVPQTSWSEVDKGSRDTGEPAIFLLAPATTRNLLKNIEEGARLAVTALFGYQSRLGDPHTFRF